MKSTGSAAFAFAFVAALAASGAVGFAQETVTVTPAPAPMAPAEFGRFVWHGNQQEIVDARYVLANGKDPVVRGFAQGLLADHATANVELRVAARAAGVSLPANEPPVSDAIKGLTGAKLDAQYMQAQYYSLILANDFMQHAAANATAPAFKAYAGVWQEYFANHLTDARWYQLGVNLGQPPASLPDPSSRTGLDLPPLGIKLLCDPVLRPGIDIQQITYMSLCAPKR
jgi:putative membrane protein